MPNHMRKYLETLKIHVSHRSEGSNIVLLNVNKKFFFMRDEVLVQMSS